MGEIIILACIKKGGSSGKRVLGTVKRVKDRHDMMKVVWRQNKQPDPKGPCHVYIQSLAGPRIHKATFTIDAVSDLPGLIEVTSSDDGTMASYAPWSIGMSYLFWGLSLSNVL